MVRWRSQVLDDFMLHHIDRDVHRLGREIVVVTAGSAVFEVSAPLSIVTENRMMDIGR